MVGAHDFAQLLDLGDASVGRAHHEIAIEQILGSRFRIQGDRATALAMVDPRQSLPPQAQCHTHVPASLLDNLRQLGLIVRHVDGTLGADPD